MIARKMLQSIDWCSENAGSLAKWFAWVLVLVGSVDTIARHFFNLPLIWAYDTMCMAGGTLYALGWSYDLLHESHIRVDLFYRSVSEKQRAVMDVLGSLFLFFPLMVAFSVTAVNWAVRAWRINETMTSTFWYPPAAPYRIIFATGVILLTLQGAAKLYRDLYFIIKGEHID